MSERVRFIARLEEGESVAELAREFGISEKTARKFRKRWQQHGVAGLEDRSHAPERIPHKTPDAVVELLLAARKQHPHWGARTLKARLETMHPGVYFPSANTIHNWLKKHGLTQLQKRRKRTPPSTTPLRRATQPNEIWATDFKGHFRLGNEMLCYPLTVTDLFSRFIVGCEALENTRAAPAWDVFERLFDEYGLPTAIRSDNGAPFAAPGLAGLTRLSARWLRLGIRLERIEPAHPEQNGQHERMHLTLKQETTRPAKQNLLQQQERFDAFVEEFNQVRPHQALQMRCPAALYQPSPRKYTGLPELRYPLADDVCVVQSPGVVVFGRRSRCYLSRALIGERVGIRELTHRRWLITFADLDLGYFNEIDKSFVPMAKSTETEPISAY